MRSDSEGPCSGTGSLQRRAEFAVPLCPASASGTRGQPCRHLTPSHHANPDLGPHWQIPLREGSSPSTTVPTRPVLQDGAKPRSTTRGCRPPPMWDAERGGVCRPLSPLSSRTERCLWGGCHGNGAVLPLIAGTPTACRDAPGGRASSASAHTRMGMEGGGDGHPWDTAPWRCSGASGSTLSPPTCPHPHLPPGGAQGGPVVPWGGHGPPMAVAWHSPSAAAALPAHSHGEPAPLFFPGPRSQQLLPLLLLGDFNPAAPMPTEAAGRVPGWPRAVFVLAAGAVAQGEEGWRLAQRPAPATCQLLAR